MKAVRRPVSTSLALALIALSACAAPAAKPQTTPPAFRAGYLVAAEVPDSLALLPPPPARSSADFAADDATFLALRALKDTPRWKLATQDADLSSPLAAGRAFACAVGVRLDDQTTPITMRLLRTMLADAGLAPNHAKETYKRARPFTEHSGAPICVPATPGLAANGSYPSGHASVGWAWALVLAEIAPERRNEILIRGRAFGESRLVCGVHWKSDVLAGRDIGAATVAALHASTAFTADAAAARAEIAATRAKSLQSVNDCAAETAALAQKY